MGLIPPPIPPPIGMPPIVPGMPAAIPGDIIGRMPPGMPPMPPMPPPIAPGMPFAIPGDIIGRIPPPMPPPIPPPIAPPIPSGDMRGPAIGPPPRAGAMYLAAGAGFGALEPLADAPLEAAAPLVDGGGALSGEPPSAGDIPPSDEPNEVCDETREVAVGDGVTAAAGFGGEPSKSPKSPAA